MDTLFNDSEIFQKERPIALSKEQKRIFLLKQAAEIIINQWSDDNAEDIADDLAMLVPFSGNGFELGKEIEKLNCYYDVDLSFCEFLENLFHSYQIEIDKNVKDWVKAHSIKPKFEKGQKVILKNKLAGIPAHTPVYITGLYEDRAIYLISEDKNKNGGYLVAYEKLENSIVLTEFNQ